MEKPIGEDKPGKDLTFVLVHGTWHRPASWDPLRRVLEDEMGAHTVAPDLPNDDLGATFDDHADVVAKTTAWDTNKLIFVGHSRGANTLPRLVSRTTVDHLVALCGSLSPSTTKALPRPRFHSEPARNSRKFLSHIDRKGNGLTLYNPGEAAKFFYHDCPTSVRDTAVGQMRSSLQHDIGPELEVWPQVPIESIIAHGDRVIRPRWSYYVANHLLKVKPIRIEGGHSPFLSRPQKLAEVLVGIANRQA
jgi:pimeloyl-ACP methyl ester carboxylesterase